MRENPFVSPFPDNLIFPPCGLAVFPNQRSARAVPLPQPVWRDALCKSHKGLLLNPNSFSNCYVLWAINQTNSPGGNAIQPSETQRLWHVGIAQTLKPGTAITTADHHNRISIDRRFSAPWGIAQCMGLQVPVWGRWYFLFFIWPHFLMIHIQDLPLGNKQHLLVLLNS